jgi:hypothetical protein
MQLFEVAIFCKFIQNRHWLGYRDYRLTGTIQVQFSSVRFGSDKAWHDGMMRLGKVIVKGECQKNKMW